MAGESMSSDLPEFDSPCGPGCGGEAEAHCTCPRLTDEAMAVYDALNARAEKAVRASYLDPIIERLENAAAALDVISQSYDTISERKRVAAKRSGVLLALSYVREEL